MSNYYALACSTCRTRTPMVTMTLGGAGLMGGADKGIPRFVAEHRLHTEDLRVICDLDDDYYDYDIEDEDHDPLR